MDDDALLDIFKVINSRWMDSVRSSLTWYSCKIIGGEPEKTIIPSLLFSISGCGTGIHDDIIDKTCLKHFKKTIPEIYGTKKALVAGNLLLVQGLRL